MSTLNIYTDGACSVDTGAGGWAYVMEMNGNTSELYGHETGATNNQMEMKAVFEGITAALCPRVSPLWSRGIDNTSVNKINIFSDSAYVVNAFEKGWIKKWKMNGWKTADKKDVKNKWVWVALDKKINELRRKGIAVRFCKVKGHSGDMLNERCDILAKKGKAIAQQTIEYGDYD